MQIDAFRYRQVQGVAIARRHVAALALGIFQGLEGEVQVALRSHQFQPVAEGETVLHLDLGQPILALAGQFTDELLALGQREAALVVLVFVMHVTAQEAFRVAAVRQ